MKRLRLIYLFLSFFPALNLIPAGSRAADGVRDELKKMNNWYRENYQELVYIHTDKNFYLTGENIKFQLFCLEKLTSRPSEFSKVAYVEILDSGNSPQLQARIEVNHGLGYGDIYIPLNLNSGNYIIRGYTRWMRNYNPVTYFHAIITIINPFKPLGLKPSGSYESASIEMSPEGGPLIGGVPARIVFHCRNTWGSPLEINGRLLDEQSVPVTEFKSGKNGLGSFEFTPLPHQNYKAEITYPDGTVSVKPLPRVKESGTSIRVDDHSLNYVIKLYLSVQERTAAGDSLSCVVYQKGINAGIFKSPIFDHVSVWELGKSVVEDGIFTINIFDSQGDFLAGRNIFKYSAEKDQLLRLDEPTVGKREKVRLDISGLIGDLAHDSIRYSVSVSSFHPSFEDQYLSLSRYLLLGNFLNGLYNPGSYFKGSVEEISGNINDLLVVFNEPADNWWNQNNESPEKLLPEYRTQLVTGRIYKGGTREPADGIFTYLSVPGKYIPFFATKSKPDGSLTFETPDLYGAARIIIQTDYKRDSVYSIEIEDPYSHDYLDVEVPEFNLDSGMAAWILKQSQGMQIQQAFLENHLVPERLTSIDSIPFYGEPDSKYNLDDYTRFNVMEEVLREYVSGVNVVRSHDGFHLKVLDMDMELLHKEDPLMLLDGVPVFDAGQIIAIDPLKIEKIETIKRRFTRGYLEFMGIVSFISYRGDLDGFSVSNVARVVEYDCVQPQQKYSFPVYPSITEKNNRIPDFRNSLYWSPANADKYIQDRIIELYTSDDSIQYEIRINGIGINGEPFSLRTEFEVAP